MRYVQLVLACGVLGVGVALLLQAAMGSDGYSTLVNGLSIATGLPFWTINIAVGAVLVGLAWVRGARPGSGTVVQWFMVGFVISLVITVVPQPAMMGLRLAYLLVALLLMTFGVAAYLASATGAGPAEAMAVAWDDVIPFRWSYNLLQATGAVIGWSLGAAVGVGTFLVLLTLGPAVHHTRRMLPALERGARPAPPRH